MSANHELKNVLKVELTNFNKKARKQRLRVDEILRELEEKFSELNDLTAEVGTQKKELHRLNNLVQLERGKLAGGKVAEKISRLLKEAKRMQEEIISKTNPKSESCFLRLFLGEINVRAFNLEDKIKMKNQYNRFMSRNAVIFIVLPLINYIFGIGPIYKMCHDFWMLYFYVSLALRENILCANGSKIKSWWIYHHYLSAIMALISATISQPEPVIYRRVLQLFVLQGAVMFIQYLYQSSRQYARVATGKASPLDVSLSETLVERPSRRRILLVLVPLLLATYLFEIRVGISIASYSATIAMRNYPAVILGCFFVVVGVMNIYTVILVLYNKESIWGVLQKFRKIPIK